MAEIKLTPEELTAQSAEMASLQKEYETLFGQVTTALNGINDNWSENLASNFSGKIQSAQKSFSSVANMLLNGSSAAKISAAGFTTPGEVLSKIDGFFDKAEAFGNVQDNQKYVQILTSEERQQLIDMLPPEMKKGAKEAANIDNWLVKNYNKIPESARDKIESIIPSDVKNTISIAHDVMQGNVSMETIGKVASIKGTIPRSIAEAGLNANLRDNQNLLNRADIAYKNGYQAFKSGNVLSGLGYASEAYVVECANGLQKIAYGVGDGFTNILGYELDNVSKVTAEVEKIVNGIPIPGEVGHIIQGSAGAVTDIVKGAGTWLRNLM